MSTRTASRVSTPIAEKNAQDVYARMVALEKEVRVKDSQLEHLTNENKALEKVGRNKDTALINMTNQLLETKQVIAKLEVEAARKSDESKQLLEERKGSYTLGVENTESLRIKELETTKDGKGILATDLYHHVMRLENELRDRDRVIGSIQEENKTLDKIIKQRADEFLILTTDLQQTKAKLISTVDPIIAENKAKELMQSIVDLQEENRMLLSIQKAKTQAIEDLTHEINARGASEQLLGQLKGEARAHTREVAKREEEKVKLQKKVEQQEALMNKFRNEEVGVPVQMWMEERRLLQAEIQKYHEQKTSMEKTIKGQKERINQLQENIDVIVKSCDGGKSPSAALRSHRRSRTFSNPPSLSNTLTSTQADSSLYNTQTENEISANGTFGDEFDTPATSVPSKLYEILERNVQRMTVALAAKESLLMEKDDALEILEKKLEVLTKARATDSKKSKLQESELREEINGLRQMVSDLQSDSKERTQQLTMELTKLKRKPIKK